MLWCCSCNLHQAYPLFMLCFLCMLVTDLNRPFCNQCRSDIILQMSYCFSLKKMLSTTLLSQTFYTAYRLRKYFKEPSLWLTLKYSSVDCRHFTLEAGLLLREDNLLLTVESLMPPVQEPELICWNAVLLFCTSIPEFSRFGPQLQSYWTTYLNSACYLFVTSERKWLCSSLIV